MKKEDYCVLFRQNHGLCPEYLFCADALPTVSLRTEARNKTVIGRYSVLPFYLEVSEDLKRMGSKLINTYNQHRWIANFDYYHDLKDYTFETWFDPQEIPDVPLVVKGRTNSYKAKWNTHMFAKNRREAINIFTELAQDPLLFEQGIIFRRYEELKLIEVGLNDQPFVNEHRVFYLGNKRLAHGFYWVQADTYREISEEGLAFADTLAKIVSQHVPFFVLDVAETANGKWVLVEINDGQMSGLSAINPLELYTNLAKELESYEHD